MINKYKIILASNSPRRRELLAGLDVEFEIKVIKGISESYPEDLPTEKIAEYIACEKTDTYAVKGNELLITADTIVVVGDSILGKPHNAEEAHAMLSMLSGKTHKVITGVCLKTAEKQKAFSVTTEVTFKQLETSEIDYYIEKYKPYDKAGSYGIQEWIGYVGVTEIRGSYYNVMGLPVQRIYEEIRKL